MATVYDEPDDLCDICGVALGRKAWKYICRVLDDDVDLPEVIGSTSMYDYYAICKKCHKIAFRSGRYVKWHIRRSDFERIRRERSMPEIKEPEIEMEDWSKRGEMKF